MNKGIFEINTEKMVGLQLNYSWRGYGSAIFLEFGKLAKKKNQNHPQGEFSLMLDCNWRVEKPRSIMFGSFCNERRIDNQIKNLIGNRVIKMELVGYLPEIIVSLSTGLRIASFSSDTGQPEWALFLPDKSWLCCKRGAIIQEKGRTTAFNGARGPCAR